MNDLILEILSSATIADRLAADRASDYRSMAIRSADRAAIFVRCGQFADAARAMIAARSNYATGIALARRAVGEWRDARFTRWTESHGWLAA